MRLLLACLLAKVHNPGVDIRKPYTAIGSPDSFSGRTYDEKYLSPFIHEHGLPCNPTTAFLTPALRNRNVVLTPDLNLEGNPPQLYHTVLELLALVHGGRVKADALLMESLRILFLVKAERSQRMETLLTDLEALDRGVTLLSSEAIVTLIKQHLNSRNASRLPVLVVAAAYKAAEKHLNERALPLRSHNAADSQTGATGDVEVALINDDKVVTCYEMKTKRVTREDINLALKKVLEKGRMVDNYIFITTEEIETTVQEYAASLYERTGGVEFVILDCIGFLRHFLHLFHRLRSDFLNRYQQLVLAEPDSAVRQELKELFLTLRQAAESGVVAE